MACLSSAPGPMDREIVARTRLLEAELEPFDAYGEGDFAWWHDGWGFVAVGEAIRVHVADVEASLAAIQVDDAVGEAATGPIAVGALPFHASDTATMVIPAAVVGRTADGRSWLTEVAPVPPLPSRGAHKPARFEVSAGMSMKEWRSAVERVLTDIGRNEVSKVVLARDVTVTCDDEIDVAAALRVLRASQPATYVFAAEGILGASPELLVSRFGDSAMSRPMAGTVTGADGLALQALARSAKDGWEHQLVANAVADGLASFCTQRPTRRGPRAVTLGSLAHLVTEIRGRLRPPAASALAMALRLHPTPAVGGHPTDRALELISCLEPHGRGRYAGPVGWVGKSGDGEFAISLRCAEVDGNRAVLHAGAGIVAGSEWSSEWRETQAKLEPVLGALVRP